MTLSPLEAIRAKCIDCCAGSRVRCVSVPPKNMFWGRCEWGIIPTGPGRHRGKQPNREKTNSPTDNRLVTVTIDPSTQPLKKSPERHEVPEKP